MNHYELIYKSNCRLDVYRACVIQANNAWDAFSKLAQLQTNIRWVEKDDSSADKLEITFFNGDTAQLKRC